MLEGARSAFLGQRFWPGRYVITSGFWYWNGRFDWQGKPDVTADPDRAMSFVSARHAYSVAGEVAGLQTWRVKRVEAKEAA